MALVGFVPGCLGAFTDVTLYTHDMLPLLAELPREFAKVKALNVLAGLVLGGAMLLLGW